MQRLSFNPIIIVLRHWALATALAVGLPTATRAATPAAPHSTPPAATTAATHPASQPATNPSTAPATAPASQPAISLAKVVSQNETVSAAVQAIQTDLHQNATVSNIQNALPAVQKRIDATLAQTQRLIAAGPSLEALRNIDSDWLDLRATTLSWKRDLSKRAETVDQNVTTLQQKQTLWNATLTQTSEQNVPADLIHQLTATNLLIQQVLTLAEHSRADVLRLQAQAAVQDARVVDALHMVGQARQTVLDHLLELDSPPIWSAQARNHAGQDLADARFTSFTAQSQALQTYLAKERGRLVAHLLLFILLTVGLFWARRRFKTWVAEEPSLAPAAPVFASPIATALVIAVLLGIWIHPSAPRLFWTIMGAGAIVPALLLLRRLAPRRLYPILYTLVILYFIDQIRGLISAIEFWPRLIFLGEMLAAVLFLALYLRRPAAVATTTPTSAPPAPKASRRGRWALRLGRLALYCLGAAFLLNAIGFNGLGTFIGNGVLHSAYIGMIFYAGVAVIDGLVILLLHLRVVSRLNAVHKFRALLRRRIHRILVVIAFLYWLWVVLAILGIREPVHTALNAALNAHGGIGSLHVTLKNVLACAITIWASFALSRFIRFLLEEDIYPHVQLPRGLGHAISALFHYALLLLGFVLAMAVLGFPMDQLGILTGAFGVGLGFGLQTIINNFFSGIILLLERPVQTGDVIEMDNLVGTILRIGIRASIIRTPTGAEIIMPNGRLVAEKVINWSLSDRCRAIDLTFTIDPAADPAQVITLLQQAAAAQEHVAKEPPPKAQFVQASAASATYSLRVWTDLVENWSPMQSSVGIAVLQALRAANIMLK